MKHRIRVLVAFLGVLAQFELPEESVFSKVELVEGGGRNSVAPFASERTIETLPKSAGYDARLRGNG